MRTFDRRGARLPFAALFVLSVLALPGCRASPVTADPEEWTEERALAVLRRVESGQVESVRSGKTGNLTERGLSVRDDAVGIPAVDPERWPGTWDAEGFEDFHFVRGEAVVVGCPGAENLGEGWSTLEKVGGTIAAVALAIAVNSASKGHVQLSGKSAPHGGQVRSVYGFRHIAFADIDRVVIDRRARPLLCVFIIMGPWEHDVVLEMKDGKRIVVYERGVTWLNLFPVWLYPAYWLHTPESYEYAEALEYLRARASERATAPVPPPPDSLGNVNPIQDTNPREVGD